MKTTSILFLIIILSITVNGQKKPKVLLTIDETEVYTDEFTRIYEKNRGMNTDDEKSVKEYLDLFINFKLKVIEAQNLDYDKDESFIRELNGYKVELAKPYLSNPIKTEDLVEEAYERYKYYINASHILFRMDRNYTPEDTLALYTKAMEYRTRLLNGEDFSTLAKEINIDRRGKGNDGNLGWFTYKKMVYPFETGAYNTPVGEISMPVRSEYGYHLIKVHEKIENPGSVKVAHIMVGLPREPSDSLIQEKKKIIDKYYQMIQEGSNFEEMAVKYSEHESSKPNGGIIENYLDMNNAPVNFIQASIALENKGDISSPVLTRYGWHIIKLLEKKPFESFEELKPWLEKSITGDSRRKRASEHAVVIDIKNKYGFKENSDNLHLLIEVIDSSIYEGTWDASVAKDLNNFLFSIGKRSYTVKEFAEYVELLEAPNKNSSIEYFIFRLLNIYEDKKIKEYAVEVLKEENKEFALIVKEYHDGILLFNLTNDKVWNKAIEDSAGLAAFYEENKGKYTWEERVQTGIYTYRDSLMTDNILPVAGDRNKNSYDQNQIREMVCDSANRKCLAFEIKKYEPGDNADIDSLDWETGTFTILKRGNRHELYYIEDIIPAGPKAFDEAKGLYTADYQNYLEQGWVKELREKYTVNVDEKVLNKLIKQYQ